MEIRSLDAAMPFTTADGSTIRSLLDLGTAPVERHSLAEATLPEGASTKRHYHRESEEIYYVVEGSGELEIDGERAQVTAGDAALIPAGSWHEIRAGEAPLRFLCTCAPPYRHEDTYFE